MNIITYQFFGGSTIPGIPRDAYTPGLPVSVDLDTMTVIPQRIEEESVEPVFSQEEIAIDNLSEGEGNAPASQVIDVQGGA